MKQLYFFILILISIATVFAQSPALINYQAVVRDGNGALITSGNVQLGISLYDSIAAGNVLYFETHNVTPNQFGLVNIQIGGGTVMSGNFLTINWGKGSKFMQMHVNGLAMGGRVQWVSVPFALHAGNGVPVGTIMAYGAGTVPDGWLLCNGDSVSRTTYVNLWNTIGITWGYGDQMSTFNLPDLRGRFLRGVDGGTGRDEDVGARTSMNTGGLAGNNVGSLQGDEFENHGHTGTTGGGTIPATPAQVFTNYYNQYIPSPPGFYAYTWNAQSFDRPLNINHSGGSSETRPENANVIYIIKY